MGAGVAGIDLDRSLVGRARGLKVPGLGRDACELQVAGGELGIFGHEVGGELPRALVGPNVYELLELLVTTVKADPVFGIVLAGIESQLRSVRAAREISERGELSSRRLVELGRVGTFVVVGAGATQAGLEALLHPEMLRAYLRARRADSWQQRVRCRS